MANHANSKRGRVEPEATWRQTSSISFCSYSNILFSLLPFSHIIMNSLSLFWLAERVQWIFEVSARDVITADCSLLLKWLVILCLSQRTILRKNVNCSPVHISDRCCIQVDFCRQHLTNSGGSRVGAWRGRPPLFKVTKRQIIEGRKAVRGTKKQDRPNLTSKSEHPPPSPWRISSLSATQFALEKVLLRVICNDWWKMLL